MSTPTLNIILDTAEPRIARDSGVLRADGRHWDILKSTAFVDAVTRTGMLMPLYKTPAWSTNSSGLYARLHKPDLSFDNPPAEPIGTPPPYPEGTPADASKWVEDITPPNGPYLVGQGVNDRVITNQKWPRNRPFLLSWFSYNSGQTSIVQMECGWISQKGFVALRIWTDGKCELYKQGVIVGEGNIFENKVTSQTVYGKETITKSAHKKASKGDSRQMASQFVDLMLIPCRRRDLLLISNQGGGFRFTFKDLDPDNPDNEITPADARFFWRVPVGQAKALLAPLNFLSSGKLIADIMGTRIQPKAGETPDVKIYRDQPGYGDGGSTGLLMEPDLSGPFTPNGVKRLARIEVDVTSDGTCSPWIYGASMVFPPVIASTDGSSAIDITEFEVSNNLSVPDNPADVTFKVTYRSPDAMEEAGAVGLLHIENRPVECKIGSISFLTGRSGLPSYREAISDEARRAMIDYRDRAKAMQEYRITDPVPVDGLELADALAYFATLPGYPLSDIDIPEFGFPVTTLGQSSQGEFALLPEVNDRALAWFDRLHKTFCPDTQWCWKPTIDGPVLKLRSLDELDAAPSQVTLYGRTEDAVNAGIDPKFAHYYVYRSLNPSFLGCDANEIYVKGQNPRTGRPFLKRWWDPKSQDPTLAPAARPGNWVGEPRKFGWVDPALIDDYLANWSLMRWARRLAVVTDLYQFTAYFQFLPDGSPVWRTDKITLDGIGDVRIRSLDGSFQLEVAGDTPEEDHLWRPFTYMGQLVHPPTI